MTKAGKLRVFAAALFAVVSLPSSSSAQAPVDGYYWSGVESYTDTIYAPFGNPPPVVYSGGGSASFSISNYGGGDTFLMAIDGTGSGDLSEFVQGFMSPVDAFGATSATGFLYQTGGPGGESGGNFFMTYDSIFPDGQINFGEGTVTADLTILEFLNPGDNLSDSIFISFQSLYVVPEPSSIVPGALATLLVAAGAWVRAFQRRRRAAPSHNA